MASFDTEIPFGPQFSMLQNVAYTLPSADSVQVIQVSAAIQTSLDGSTWTTTNSSILSGIFVRCATGNATITLRKNGVG
jgi:hypothetical protein